MYFDARKAKALKEGEHLVVDGCKGLRLEATKTKKTWTYRYKSPLDGRMRQVRIGTWPEMPPVAAASTWQALRARREAGEDVAVEKRQARLVSRAGPDKGYTLGQLIEDYIAEHLDAHREPRSARGVKQRLRRAISGHKDMLASGVSRTFVYDLISSLSETPVVAKSVKNEMGAAWALATNAGRVDENQPNWWRAVTVDMRSKGAMRDGVRKGRSKRILRNDELRLLFTGQMHLFSEQVQDFLTLQMWTVARGGEVCQMRADQLEEVDGVLWWTLPKELIKTRHHESATDLRVPLLGRARKVVEKLRSRSVDWLFPSETRAGERTYVKQPYMQSKVHYRQPYCTSRPDHVRERLRVSHWSPHDLRRTGRTLLTALGCPRDVAEALLGHVKPGVVGVYDLYGYDRERVEWLGQLDAALDRIIGAA